MGLRKGGESGTCAVIRRGLDWIRDEQCCLGWDLDLVQHSNQDWGWGWIEWGHDREWAWGGGT